MSERVFGTVKAFDVTTGNGFLARDNGPDVFFQVSALPSEGARSLRTGQTVEFSIVQGPKGPKAVNIVIGK